MVHQQVRVSDGANDGTPVTPRVGVVGVELRGRDLRYVLTTLLRDAPGPLTVAELVAGCEAEGITFTGGRASKIVSDSLRWEIRWGRVRRVRRGVYRFDRAPRSTLHWIRRRVHLLRDYLARARVGEAAVFPRPSPMSLVLIPALVPIPVLVPDPALVLTPRRH